MRSVDGRILAGWHRTADNARYSNLEATFLLAAAMTPEGPMAVRMAGTLENNDVNQQRILFEAHTLIRVRDGARRNLVVKASTLKMDEDGVPAGSFKLLEPGREHWKMSETRMRDHEMLDNIEHLLARPCHEVTTLPCPDAYKCVRDTAGLQPRTCGRLIAQLKELGADLEGRPLADVFREHVEQMAIRENGSLLLPFGTVVGRGMTLLDLSSVQDECYSIPAAQPDRATDVMRVNLQDALRKPSDAV